PRMRGAPYGIRTRVTALRGLASVQHHRLESIARRRNAEKTSIQSLAPSCHVNCAPRPTLSETVRRWPWYSFEEGASDREELSTCQDNTATFACKPGRLANSCLVRKNRTGTNCAEDCASGTTRARPPGPGYSKSTGMASVRSGG